MRKVFERIWRKWQIGVICGTQNHLLIRGKNLCVHGKDAKRLLTYSPNTPKDITVCLSRLIIIQLLNFLKILSIYIIWDGLSQKTISRYCPFKWIELLWSCVDYQNRAVSNQLTGRWKGGGALGGVGVEMC
jgi:hypothetical protein